MNFQLVLHSSVLSQGSSSKNKSCRRERSIFEGGCSLWQETLLADSPLREMSDILGIRHDRDSALYSDLGQPFHARTPSEDCSGNPITLLQIWGDGFLMPAFVLRLLDGGSYLKGWDVWSICWFWDSFTYFLLMQIFRFFF